MGMVGLGSRRGADTHVLFAIGRVGKNQVKLSAGFRKLSRGGKHILGPRLEILKTETGRDHVLAQNLGVARGSLDANGASGSPTEAFKAQRAGPGKQLEHAGPHHPVPQTVENSLLDQVGRWPDGQPLGHLELPPRGTATGDAHPGI